MHPDVEIDDDQVAFFAEHGYLVLDRITTDEELDWLRATYDDVRGATPNRFPRRRVRRREAVRLARRARPRPVAVPGTPGRRRARHAHVAELDASRGRVCSTCPRRPSRAGAT